MFRRALAGVSMGVPATVASTAALAAIPLSASSASLTTMTQALFQARKPGRPTKKTAAASSPSRPTRVTISPMKKKSAHPTAVGAAGKRVVMSPGHAGPPRAVLLNEEPSSSDNYSGSGIPQYAAARPVGEPDRKELAIRIFQEVMQIWQTKGDLYRMRAYGGAINLLKKYPGPIYSNTKVPGLGARSAEKLEEICKTGTLSVLKKYRMEAPDAAAIAALTSINGVGPATAKKWNQTYNLETVEDVKANMDRLGLTDAQKMGLKHYKDCQLRIPYDEVRHHNAILQRGAAAVFGGEVVGQPRVKLSNRKKTLDILCTDDPSCSVKLVICGSHRRGKAHSGDVDALMTYSDNYARKKGLNRVKTGFAHHGDVEVEKEGRIDRLATYLEENGGGGGNNNSSNDDGYIVDSIASGDTKLMAYARLPGIMNQGIPTAKGKTYKPKLYPVRRLDIRWVPYQCFPFAMLYFTGSKEFNERMRAHALQKGYTLNEYGLYKIPNDPETGKPDLSKEVVRATARDPSKCVQGITCEEDIFRVLEFPYVNPSEREA